jgi:hypothetical protein
VSTKLDVWCEALRLLQMTVVSSTDPVDETTRIFNAAWHKTAKVCLEAGDWDFAKKRGALSRVTPAPAFGWSYYYAVPSDSCRLVYVSETGVPDDPLLRYAHEENKIATDAETVYAIWISTTAIDTPGRWSESFATYVAATLAKQALRINPGARDEVEDALKRSRPQAAGHDAVQNPPAMRRPGRWASAARGSGT